MPVSSLVGGGPSGKGVPALVCWCLGGGLSFLPEILSWVAYICTPHLALGLEPDARKGLSPARYC